MFSFLLKDLSFLFLFVITAASDVPCGGRKKFPRSKLVQIIYYFCSFEIIECILRTRKCSYVKTHFLNKFQMFLLLVDFESCL